MATFRVFLDQRRSNLFEQYPIKIRITVNRKSREFSTGIKVAESQFNSKAQKVNDTHPNHQLLNISIRKRKVELEEELMTLQLSGDQHALQQLDKKQEELCTDLVSFMLVVIDQLHEAGKIGTANVYRDSLNSIRRFQADSLPMDQITPSWLYNYNSHLDKRGLKVNSKSVYLRTLRAVLNRAIKQGLMKHEDYPFRQFVIRQQKTLKRAISRADIRKLEELEFEPNSQLWHARNYFLLSFYLIGCAFADLSSLTKDNLNLGRMEYIRAKTGIYYSIAILPQVYEILKLYAKADTPLLLPILAGIDLDNPQARKTRIQQQLKTTNKYLGRIAEQCGIEAHLTTYVARHSWATIARQKGYSVDQIGEALGHRIASVTHTYLKEYGTTVVDGMNIEVSGYQND